MLDSDLLLGFIFISLPFELFQKRGPYKVGDANKFIPRCPLNFEEHGVRYAGLDRSAVGSGKYFTALALSKGGCLRFSGHNPSIIPCGFRKMRLFFLDNALRPKIDRVARDKHPPFGGASWRSVCGLGSECCRQR